MEGDTYVFSKQYSPPNHYYRVPDDALVFMTGHSMYQFDLVNKNKELFAMKLQDRTWATFDSIEEIISTFKEHRGLLHVTNGDHQIILTEIL